MSPAARGRICVLSAAALWSAGGVMIRAATREFHADFAAVACLRSAFAGLALAWAIPSARSAFGPRAFAAALWYAALLGSFVAATAMTTAAHAIFLQYLYPLLVAIGARVIYREAISRAGYAALALGVAGIATILAGSVGQIDAKGLALGLGSAVFFSGFVLTQRGMPKASPLGLTAAYNLIAAGVLLPFAIGKFALAPQAWGLIAAMGVFQIGVPYVLFLRGMRDLPTAEAAILTLLEPVLNPMWVYLFLGEPVDGWTLGGGGLILAAVVVRLASTPAAR